MKCTKGDIIKDGDKLYFVFAVLGSVIYVRTLPDVYDSPSFDHELKEVLKYYRKTEVMEK